jgi:2-amino-4-hydroxy-6-hydroxymethyldihydropteridine diphosphokinase
MAIAYLSLGSNMGERERMLKTAVELLSKRSGDILDRSAVYETEPWGNKEQPVFLNQIISIDTPLSAEELLDEIHFVERQMGRIRNGKPFQPRYVDIDILLYDQLVLQSERLTIPHPLMHRRAFILVPLMEIAPGLMHPLLKRSVKELYSETTDPCAVKRYWPAINEAAG